MQLDTCLAKLDLHEFLGHVLVGLSDDSDEVKVICHMMLFRLAQVAPTAISQRLDDITPALEKSMKGATVTKDTVKQDLERALEEQEDRVSMTLERMKKAETYTAECQIELGKVRVENSELEKLNVSIFCFRP